MVDLLNFLESILGGTGTGGGVIMGGNSINNFIPLLLCDDSE